MTCDTRLYFADGGVKGFEMLTVCARINTEVKMEVCWCQEKLEGEASNQSYWATGQWVVGCCVEPAET